MRAMSQSTAHRVRTAPFLKVHALTVEWRSDDREGPDQTQGPERGLTALSGRVKADKTAAGIDASHVLQHDSRRLSIDVQVVKLKLSGCAAERTSSWDRPRNHAQDGIPSTG